MWVLEMEPESSGRASSVVGDSFALFPRTVNKLNLDLGDGVHAQLTRINHRGFVADSDGERGTHGGRRRGLEVSWTLLGLGKAERRVSWAFLRCFVDLPGSYPTI